MEFTISASELFQKAKEILNDGMDRVTIDLFEEDTTDPEDPIPACVHFSAFRSSRPYEEIDYESIDVVGTSS